MKMFVIVYNEVSDDNVIDALKKAGIKSYTKIKEARGEGSETEPKLGTHVWPGKNNILLIAARDEETSLIIDMVRKLKKEHPKSGIRSFLLPMEEII